MPDSSNISNFDLQEAPLLANLSIEASAGSGKTYTLEQIVCRLIEHHGLNIEQILLLTYTEKAAAELKERIRGRLSLRLSKLNNISQPYQRIEKALSQYNQANISTIHAFFRRTLEQFALETGENLAPQKKAEIDPSARPLRRLLLEELQGRNFSPHETLCLSLAGPILGTQKGGAFNLNKLLELFEESGMESFWRDHPGFSLVPGQVESAAFEQIAKDFDQEQGAAYKAFCNLARSEWPAVAFSKTLSSKAPKNLPKNYNAATAQKFFNRLKELASQTPKEGYFLKLLQLLLHCPPHPKHPGDSNQTLAPYVELLYMLHPTNIERINEKYVNKNGNIESWAYYKQVLCVEAFCTALLPCIHSGQKNTPEPEQAAAWLRSLFAARFLLALRKRLAPKLKLERLLHGIRSFDEMAEGLYQILVLRNYGKPEDLLRLLRSQYHCLLVDEFQDTDTIQWQILFQIFGSGNILQRQPQIERSHNFIVVGDPKQSIYRFRGANAELYRIVQQSCDRWYRLPSNYRSNTAAVKACNLIFSNIWGTDKANNRQNNRKKNIVFEPATAALTEAKAPDFLLNISQSSAHPSFCFLDCGEPNKETAQILEQSITAVAQKIVELLGGNYALGSSEKTAQSSRSLQGGDIAVLMDRRAHCHTLHERLGTLGIASQIQERRSIFADSNAKSLHYFLQALCRPHELEHSLQLFLSPLFALEITDAKRLLGLEPNQNSGSPDFLTQLDTWKDMVEKGQWLAAVQELFAYTPAQSPQKEKNNVYNRILAGNTNFSKPKDDELAFVPSLSAQRRINGREAYSNLRQLVEAIGAEQNARRLNARELCRFLSQQIQHAAEPNTEHLQQDCSEGQAVQIMTIHSAKGLEFPVVFLGSIGLSQPRKGRVVSFQTARQDAGQLSCKQTLYLAASTETHQMEREEEYRELQRLFYVALTRARAKIYLPFHAKARRNSPYLRLIREALASEDTASLRESLENLLQKYPQYFENILTNTGMPKTENSTQNTREKDGQDSAKNKPARKLQCDNLENRFPKVSSFTSLQRTLSAHEWTPQTSPTSALEDQLGSKQDKEQDAAPENQAPQDEEICWHELFLSPGAAMGNLLHDLLENVDYSLVDQAKNAEQLQQNPQFSELLKQKSRRYFPRYWINRAKPALSRIIWNTLHCELPTATNAKSEDAHDNNTKNMRSNAEFVRLCQLETSQRKHELEFLFSLPKDCQLEGRLFLLEASQKLQIDSGFLKGFIDLLFLHDGKLYLLDWKSNFQSHLWDGWSQRKENELHTLQKELYQPVALSKLIESHHYSMQYLIYLCAVYRYLKLQYGSDFCYSKHFGGCYYLFLRGMQTGSDSGIYYCKPEETLLQEILQKMGIFSDNHK